MDVSAIEEAWMRCHSAAGSANRRVPFKVARKNSEKLEERFELFYLENALHSCFDRNARVEGWIETSVS